MDHRKRQKRLIEALEQRRLNSLLVTHMPNVRYLCGFTGSAGVLAVKHKARRRHQLALFTDGRYTEQARRESVGARVVTTQMPALMAAADWLAGDDGRRELVGFEAEHLSVASNRSLTKAAPKLHLKATSSLVERLRMVKDADEVAQIRSAVQLASRVFETAVADIKPGMAENEIAAEIEYLCRRMGAEGMSFDTLVAAGARSSLPHGVASSNSVPSKGFVILDFGVILGGYCSDMTRTIHVGHPDKTALAIYAAVLKAQLAGIAAVRPGVKTSEVDYAARNVLDKAGFGRYFTHSTGHGVGLEIHEPPGLRKAPKAKLSAKQARERSSGTTDRLEPGMVITIEPGVYVPEQGGVRIEDMVLVTEQGCDVLTTTSKELITI